MRNEINELLKNYEYMGVNVLTATKSSITCCNSFGFQNKEDNIKTTPMTIYRIASISKVIVALGIMKLVESGVLDIHEDISKYLGYKVRNPYYPNDYITLEMLMTQTSSINDGYDNPKKGYDGVNGKNIYVSLKDLLTNPDSKYYLKDTFLNEKPGTIWNYSNFGCGILACIIEKVTGEYFTDYIRRILLLPLNIDGSYRVSDIKRKDLIASLYIYNDNRFKLNRNANKFLENENPRYPLGDNFRMVAGGLFISILDLAKIMQLLMNKGKYHDFRYLNSTTIDEMERIHWQGESDDPSYKKKGLQLLLLDGYTDETLKGHFGNAYGLRSYMLYTREKGYIFLCNGADYQTMCDHMVKLENDMLRAQIKYFPNEVKKVKKIERGSRIGLICPSSPVKDSTQLQQYLDFLEKNNISYKLGKSISASDGYLAGSDELRTNDIINMFEDDSIDGILCFKGGYGTTRLIDKVNFEIIKQHPKLLVGFSDVTVLLNSIYQFTNIPSLHGNMGICYKEENKQINQNFLEAISTNYAFLKNRDEKIEVICAGNAFGKIVGGNLSLVAALMGTPYEIDTKDKIIFLEDVDEPIYSIDRMLSTLSLAGKFKDAAGIILGKFTNTGDNKNEQTLEDLFDRYFRNLNIPVIANFESGHIKNFINIPIGVNCLLDTDSETVIVLECLFFDN